MRKGQIKNISEITFGNANCHPTKQKQTFFINT